MKNLPRIAGLIFIHGSFARPFLNMLLDSEIDQTWREYFSAIKYKWEKDYEKSLKSSKAGLRRLKRVHGDSFDPDESADSRKFQVLRRYTKDKTLYYLLMMEELSVLMKYPDGKNDEILRKLERSYSRMPQLPREMAKSIFLNYRAIMNTGRFKPRGGKVDPQAEVFVLIGNAKNMIRKGRLSKAFPLFKRAAKIAKEIPHPTGFVGCLNDMAWYTMKVHPRVACRVAKGAVYWGGWYKEKITDIFYTLDTLFEIQLNSRDGSILTTSELMNESKELLPVGNGWGTLSHYEDLLVRSSKFVPDYERSSYRNTQDLRRWLENLGSISQIHKISGISRANLYSIINGKTDTVRGETLKKLLTAMVGKRDFDLPFAVFNEKIKAKIEKDFENAVNTLDGMDPEERGVRMFFAYSAKVSRRKSLPYLSRKGVLKKMFDLCARMGDFKEFASRRYETMKFVHEAVAEMHPFFEARRDLVMEFFGRLTVEKRKILIEAYLGSDEERREVGDRFMRNYVRYDIDWGIKLKLPEEIKGFSKKYDLDGTLSTVAFWALEKKEMKNFLKLKGTKRKAPSLQRP